MAVGAVAAVTAVAWVVPTAHDPAVHRVVYVLAIAMTGAYIGRGPAIVCAVASLLAADFLFVEPAFSMEVAAVGDVVTLLVFLAMGILTGNLAGRLRDRAETARRMAEQEVRLREETVRVEVLRRTDDLRHSLLRAVSHDLRSPLAAIKLAAGTLRDAWPDGTAPTPEEEARHAAATQIEADADRLVALGVRRDRITVAGDTRYDQVWDRVRDSTTGAHRVVVARLSSNRFTVVAGSTWPGDEACIFDAWQAIRQAVPGARLIIAPHEPEPAAVAALETRAVRTGVTAARLDAATTDTDLIIVDRVGVLADLYAIADVAYVGGGFHDAGLHSVVEPAAHGVPVLFGPKHEASRDAGLLLAADGGWSVDGPSAFSARTITLATEPETRTRAGERARAVVQSELGAADRAAALVLPLLKPLRPSR
mgnify:CR=1 FL=1